MGGLGHELQHLRNKIETHIGPQEDHAYVQMYRNNYVPGMRENHELRNTILAGIGLIATSILIGTGLIALEVPMVPMIASLETGMLEESTIMAPSLGQWFTNIMSRLG